jgi:hypothetical protein
MKMAELITITDGKKVITVTKKAFKVIYKRNGFKDFAEKKEEKKTKRTTSRKKKSGEDN